MLSASSPRPERSSSSTTSSARCRKAPKPAIGPHGRRKAGTLPLCVTRLASAPTPKFAWEAAATYHEEVLGGSTRLESFTIDRNGHAARWTSALRRSRGNWLGQPLEPQRVQYDDDA